MPVSCRRALPHFLAELQKGEKLFVILVRHSVHTVSVGICKYAFFLQYSAYISLSRRILVNGLLFFAWLRALHGDASQSHTISQGADGIHFDKKPPEPFRINRKYNSLRSSRPVLRLALPIVFLQCSHYIWAYIFACFYALALCKISMLCRVIHFVLHQSFG